MLELAEQEALLRGEAMGLELFAHGYRFLVFSESGWQEETGDAVFRARQLDGDIRIILRVDGENRVLAERAGMSAQTSPQILLTPDGNSETIQIDISDTQGVMQISNGGAQGWTIVDAAVES